jgi:hypothetical protein
LLSSIGIRALALERLSFLTIGGWSFLPSAVAVASLSAPSPSSPFCVPPTTPRRSMNVATSDLRARLLAGGSKDGVAGLERWNRRGVDEAVELSR